MKILTITARIITGLVFMFSGTVKAIDPMGSAFKFQDYFQAFNLGFLRDLALPLALLLITVEFMAGFFVLTGIRQKTGIIMVMILMAVFTPLTFFLALTNPVSDCGCFGDAIHLTNWQTFGKNVFLLIPVLFLLINRKKVKQNFSSKNEWFATASATALFILFTFYNLIYLPVIDFLPYKKGVNIIESMKIPENAPSARYETTFIYEKDGVRKEFDLTNYPAEDSSWIFIDQKSVLVEKGYIPPIHDFSLISMDAETQDITEKVLSFEGTTVFMISRKLSQASEKHLLAGFDLGKYCLNNSIPFYVLTASGSGEAKSYQNGLEFCTVDETTLKTMVRTNPGYMLLENGVIKKKWSWANIPEDF